MDQPTQDFKEGTVAIAAAQTEGTFEEQIVKKTAERLTLECLKDERTHPVKHYEKWVSGIPHEIMFWWHHIATEGRNWGLQDHIRSLGTPREFSGKAFFPNFTKPLLRALDVGAGATTMTGSVWKGKTVEVHAVDPLARAYAWIYETFGIKPAIPVLPGHAERLRQMYAPGYFDYVVANNCMDHMYEPLSALEQMAELLAKDGVMRLWHCINEAEFEKYIGLHQWNMNMENDHVIFWNKEGKEIFPHEKFGLNLVSVKYAENPRACFEVIFKK